MKPGFRRDVTDPAWRRLALKLAGARLGAALAVCALVGGLYRDRLHFIWALCAAGALLIARGWWAYLRRTRPGGPAPEREARPKVPYALRRDQGTRRHKPAFLMTAADFDDDLTPDTVVDAEAFDAAQRARALIAACVVDGALLFLLSLLLPQ